MTRSSRRSAIAATLSRRRRGAAATEAAILLPIMLSLALGAVDFGRVLGLSMELSNAARIGAECGATHIPTSLTYDSWLARINSTVLDDLNATQDFKPSQITIAVNLLTDAQGNQLVQVTVNYLFTTAVNWPFIPTQVPLQSKVAMRQYR